MTRQTCPYIPWRFLWEDFPLLALAWKLFMSSRFFFLLSQVNLLGNFRLSWAFLNVLRLLKNNPPILDWVSLKVRWSINFINLITLWLSLCVPLSLQSLLKFLVFSLKFCHHWFLTFIWILSFLGFLSLLLRLGLPFYLGLNIWLCFVAPNFFIIDTIKGFNIDQTFNFFCQGVACIFGL